jgi:peptide chain release factor 2
VIDSKKPRSFFDKGAWFDQLVQLEEKTLDPAFWTNNTEETKELLIKLEKAKRFKNQWDELLHLNDEMQTALELLELDENDEEVQLRIQEIDSQLLAQLREFEMKCFLNGPYDQLSCYLSFSSGAGGVDAMDWTEILYKMYLNYIKRKGFKATILSISEGQEAGIKSATIEVLGDFAFGFLKSEKGVHRLVRISPFDANKRRHTSFSLVEVVPIIPEVLFDIDEKDLRIDTYNASGHGGQNVQKNDTAVRIVHEPTGVVAVCQSERSQQSNKDAAMKILRSKLMAKMDELRLKELNELKLQQVSAEWGSQIRSYVLQPYTIVKDLRTGYEQGNVAEVLEGYLDEFVWEYIGFSAARQNQS